MPVWYYRTTCTSLNVQVNLNIQPELLLVAVLALAVTGTARSYSNELERLPVRPCLATGVTLALAVGSFEVGWRQLKTYQDVLCYSSCGFELCLNLEPASGSLKYLTGCTAAKISFDEVIQVVSETSNLLYLGCQ
jgi:hypothetical protein